MDTCIVHILVLQHFCDKRLGDSEFSNVLVEFHHSYC